MMSVWRVLATFALILVVVSCAGRQPRNPATTSADPREPLLTQGEKIFQLSQLTAESAAEEVNLSFKVKASVPSQETVSVVIFAPYRQPTSLDALEVKAAEIENRSFGIISMGGTVSPMLSTYRVRQGVFLGFNAPSEQLNAGEIKFRITKTEWEKPLQIGLAQQKKTQENYSSYTLISNTLTNAK